MIYNGKRYVVSPYSFRRLPMEFNEVAEDVVSFVAASPADADLGALLSQLESAYDVDRPTLDRDVRAFLDECIDKDYLINADLDVESDAAITWIQAAQEKIPALTVTNFGYEVRLGRALTPGCQSCSRGKWAVFHVGAACNLACSFCPYIDTQLRQQADASDGAGAIKSISFLGTQFRSPRDLKFQFSLIHEDFDAFAWVGGEPMMPAVQSALLPLIRYFYETYPTYHQWLYTNGSFATRKAMQELYDAGIRELRFNLAATGFSRQVIARMKDARRIFDYVCLESPMTKDCYQGLMANVPEILDTGLDQMNLAEFIVGRQHLADPATLDEEGRLYLYKGFICSPVQSRRYTYEVIERAAAEAWPVVINDCSNEYKYYKLSKKHRGPNIFDGCLGYWNNGYALHDVDRFNDRHPR